MTILAFLLSVVAIFISGTRGVVVWVLGTALLWFLCDRAFLTYLTTGQAPPILLIAVGISVLSILIGRWWGLLFNLLASVLLFVNVWV